MPLPPQRRKQLTLQVLADLLVLLDGPAMLIVEDAHWIDPSTEELLGLIVDRAPALPLLALITFRPTYRPPWAGRSDVATLSLTRLGRAETTAIIDGIAGALPPPVAEQIRA